MPNAPAGTSAEGLPIDQNIDRLMLQLQRALAALGCGPVRAIIDSDGACCVQEMKGRPIVGGGRLAGTPVRMLRIDEDPFGPVPGIRIRGQS